jgi:Universal stress protein family
MTVLFLCSSVHRRHLHLVRSNNDGERCRRDDAPKASTQSGGLMSSEATRSEFVVGVDGSVASYAAVSWAAHEATMRGLPIKLVHVVAPTLMSSTMAPNDTITQEQEDKARQILTRPGRRGPRWRLT